MRVATTEKRRGKLKNTVSPFSSILYCSMKDCFVALSTLYFYCILESYDPQEATTNSSAKKRLCMNISRSGYYHGIQREAINTNRVRIYFELRLKYPSIWRELYSKPTSQRWWIGLPHYTNHTQNIQVELFDEQTVPEQVFVCIVRSTRTKMISKYYVSEEYKVRQAVDAPENYIVGRFIIAFNDNKFKVRLLAEEPARVLPNGMYSIEAMYLEARQNKQPGTISYILSRCESIH